MEREYEIWLKSHMPEDLYDAMCRDIGEMRREIRGCVIAASRIKDGGKVAYYPLREVFRLDEFEGATLRHLFWVIGG